MTTKTLFSSSPLIFLRHKSINKVSCTRIDISIYRNCLVDIFAELIDVLIKLTDMLVKVK